MNPAWRRRTLRFRLVTGVAGVAAVVLAIALTLAGASPWPQGLLLWAGATLAVATATAVMARHVLAPAASMASQARDLSWQRQNTRLPVSNPHDEFGQLADAFNNLLARLDDTISEVQRFSMDASHELRTPLTAVRTIGEVALARPGDVPALREAVGSMLEQVDAMSRMVEQLLLLTRDQAGELDLQLQPVAVHQLLADLRDTLQLLAGEKQQDIRLPSTPDVGDGSGPATTPATDLATGTTEPDQAAGSDGNASSLRLVADPSLLRLALVNLLQNAIRHSPRGATIHIGVRASRDVVTIEVRDHGPGIARGHQARIFDRFYRVDSGRSRTGDGGGAGLGLAITKWAVERCGGEIGLRSSPGQGSTFFICLPRDQDTTAGSASRSQP